MIELAKKQDKRPNVAATINLHVAQQSDGSYGVFANEVIITSHITQAAAQAHCQRLLVQQAAEMAAQ